MNGAFGLESEHFAGFGRNSVKFAQLDVRNSEIGHGVAGQAAVAATIDYLGGMGGSSVRGVFRRRVNARQVATTALLMWWVLMA